MKTEKWFNNLVESYKDDLEYRTEAAILEFNEKVVAHMGAKGISRVELARRLGVSKASVTKMLNGNPNLTIKTMISVAAALDCELNLDIFNKGLEPRNMYVTHDKKILKEGFTRDVVPAIGDECECAA